ncbi:MAG: CsbD family protein [Actinobacteria bacterium]|nr:CsbD family protein [Actinomycetota bacterium]
MTRKGGKTSGDDRTEGGVDKTKGRMKEAVGALTGDDRLKKEGRSDQRKGTAKEKKGKLKNLFE